MLIVGIIIIIIIGILAIDFISVNISWGEKAGLAFPVGMGLQTLLMALIDSTGIPLTPACVLGIGVCLIAALSIPLYFKKEEVMAYYKSSPHFSISDYNLVWLFFIILIGYLEYMNFAKCIYYPTFDRDSLAGFDTIGYVVSQEHTYKKQSLFQADYMPQIHNAGSYISYAPMVQLSCAFVYLMGAESSKLVPALMYLFFLIAFYSSMRRVAGRTCCAVGTFFLLITPEMLAFSSMSATNVIHAVSASLGIIYISLWFRFRERKDLYLGALLLGLNVWTRTDGVVFIGAALCVVAVDAIQRKSWKGLWPVATSFFPAFVWMALTRINHLYSDSIAIIYPYWDAEKANIIWKYMEALYMNTHYYGWTFVALLGSLLVNCWYLSKKKDNIALLVLIIVSAVLYMIVLYQIDYKWDSIQNVLAYSAKRFLFCFVPMVWFYSMSNHVIKRGFDKIDAFLAK